VIFFFLNKAASYGQEFQVSRDTVKVSVQEGNTSPHNERSGFIKKKGNHNKTSKYFPAHKMIILIFGTNIWLYQSFVPNDW
jgi:hypothetical protein